MKLKTELEKLRFEEGDVLIVKGDGEEAGAVAERLSTSGLVPEGTAIIVLKPEIDVFSLRNAPEKIKKQIFDAMALEGVECDWEVH